MPVRKNKTTSSSNKNISAKRLNKIITTYRKNNKYIFKDIMMLAEAQGVKLKRGSLENEKWITSNKRKAKQIQKLYEQIQTKYGGSYSQYEKGLKKRYRAYKESLDEGVQPIPFNKYDLFLESRRELANEIYKIAYALDQVQNTNDNVEEATTVYDYSLDKTKAGRESDSLLELINHLRELQLQADRYGIDYNRNIYSKIRF